MLATDVALRLGEALAFVSAHVPAHGVTIVGATREAADELARAVARAHPSTIGVSRFSLTQLAVRVAGPALAAQGVAPSSPLAFEAVAARAAFDLAQDQVLGALTAASSTPGFPRAVARTGADLRAARVSPQRVEQLQDPEAQGLARLHARMAAELSAAGAVDRDGLLSAAAVAVPGEAWLRAPLVLLDVALESEGERAFVGALLAAASTAMATCHLFDEPSALGFEKLGGSRRRLREPMHSDVEHLRAQLFSKTPARVRESDGSVERFSAPGEGRECVEIARRILREAARGVAFDEMAIFVRSPAHYQGLLEHALQRAGVPAWFDRGTRRPHPVGRAFLALLACAEEGLSARRFAEYLSLGQLPPREVAVNGAGSEAVEAATEDSEALKVGTLPTPRRWEQMLVEAAVRRGDPSRWRRRLFGLDAELAARQVEATRTDPESPRGQAIARDRARLKLLAAFALPLIEQMASWPREATWGDWLGLLEGLAPQVVGTPGPVLGVLADLRPMARVGPVALREVRHVLADRLRLVEDEPPAQRYGRVFVGGPARARGRAFRVGFVPGLAERVFPEKLRQDPLLLDGARERLQAGLGTQQTRGAQERMLLHLAVGACRERLYVSYPRLDVAESRARVPSFYALDIVRGITGTVPDHRAFADAAGRVGQSSLAWPAPLDPEMAIDAQEHDLAVIRSLLDADPSVDVRGQGQYLLRLNAALRRAVVERWARAMPAWSQYDGLIRVVDETRAVLAAHRLTARPYSASALQRFSVCPYQFLLGAIHRLHRAEGLEPLQHLDPLTRGSLVHRIQAVTLRALRDAGVLPLGPQHLDAAMEALRGAVAAVSEEFKERVAPAIDRVWADEVAVVARDLRGWLARVATENGPWEARYIELGFGLPADVDRDDASTGDAVPVDGRFPLRGAIDLVEVHRQTGDLRVTDHKTGKDRNLDGFVIAGGAVLQPLLYAAAAERVLGAPVAETRLFYCTVEGGYRERPVPLTPQTRRLGVEALEVIDRAVEMGVLVPAPTEGACARCDFAVVCGPSAEEHAARKTAGLLRDLQELRSRR